MREITKVIHNGLSKADLIEWLDGEIEKNCKLYKHYEIDSAFFEQAQLRKQKETFEKVKQHIESIENAPIAEVTVDPSPEMVKMVKQDYIYDPNKPSSIEFIAPNAVSIGYKLIKVN